MLLFRDRSLKQKLRRIITLTSSAGLLLACMAFMIYDQLSFKKAMVRDLSSAAEILGTNGAAALLFDDSGTAEEILSALKAKPAVVSAFIYTPLGEVLAGYHRDGAVEDLQPPEVEADGSRFANGHLIVFQRIYLEREQVGTIFIKSDLGEIHSRLKRYGIVVVIVMLGAALVTLLIASKLTRGIVSPIRELSQVAHKIANGDLEHKIEINTGDEIEELAQAFDQMLARLRDYRVQVESHQRSLEDKVRERTTGLREATERAYELAEKAEAASKAKSQFLANMSHEIRTPMNGVLGMTELVLTTNLTEKQRRYAETIRGSAEALLSVLNDILDFSKIEAGRLVLDSIDFDLRREVEDVSELFAELAHGKGLEFLCAIPPDMPTGVRGDPGRIRQILSNLVGNALKFTETGEIAVHVSTESSDEKEICVRFVVKDTGIGIPPEGFEGIFESFAQADGSTTRKYGGTGLGLTICKQLVELMGGEIGLESKAGVGSSFWFTARFERRPEAVAGMRQPGRIIGLRVLVVDDNATNLELLDSELRAWGAIPVLVGNAKQALEQLRLSVKDGERFDVAILDLMMPGMDGLDLARAIRANDDLSSLRLLMLTSLGAPVETEVQDTGITTFLSKPVRQSHLFDALMSVLNETDGTDAKVTTPQRSEPEELTSFGASVLLVEDQRVNQEVAQNLLHLLGCSVDLASNGVEAVEAVRAKQYDMVFMDCQMPIMDGYKAARCIREGEASGNAQSYTTIVALTAHAMQGDKERCLAAGMDDYLSKPFKLAELQAVLARWLRAETDESETATPAAVAIPSPAPVVDPPQASSECIDPNAFDQLRAFERQGAKGVVKRTIEFYLEDAPDLLSSLREAVSSSDPDALRQAAHSLKSSSANLGALRMSELCKQLEMMGRAESTEGATALLAQAEAEFGQVQSALEAESRR